jgi:hypothetical protein
MILAPTVDQREGQDVFRIAFKNIAAELRNEIDNIMGAFRSLATRVRKRLIGKTGFLQKAEIKINLFYRCFIGHGHSV